MSYISNQEEATNIGVVTWHPRRLMTYWPLIVTVLAIAGTAGAANARLDNLSDRVEYIWNNGPPPLAIRLTRIEEKQTHIEEKQKEMNETLIRIEEKIDDKYSVSPEAKRKLRKL